MTEGPLDCTESNLLSKKHVFPIFLFHTALSDKRVTWVRVGRWTGLFWKVFLVRYTDRLVLWIPALPTVLRSRSSSSSSPLSLLTLSGPKTTTRGWHRNTHYTGYLLPCPISSHFTVPLQELNVLASLRCLTVPTVQCTGVSGGLISGDTLWCDTPTPNLDHHFPSSSHMAVGLIPITVRCIKKKRRYGKIQVH